MLLLGFTLVVLLVVLMSFSDLFDWDLMFDVTSVAAIISLTVFFIGLLVYAWVEVLS